MRLRGLVALVLTVAPVAACSSRSAEVASGATTTTRPRAAHDAVSPPASARDTTTIATTSTTAAAIAPVAPAPTPVAASPSAASPLDVVGSAAQAVVVHASGYGETRATLTAYQRSVDGWQPALGPWKAWVGYNGFAPPDEKREGDGRTPSGVYRFGFFFGVQPDPGVRFPYRQVTPSTVWSDDPNSPRYNQWVDSRQQDAGAEPEAMYQPAAYAYGAVIAYNPARTPGLGSAIFLHVSTGGPTAGCVSLPMSQLLEVLRWLDPARGPLVVMTVG